MNHWVQHLYYNRELKVTAQTVLTSEKGGVVVVWYDYESGDALIFEYHPDKQRPTAIQAWSTPKEDLIKYLTETFRGYSIKQDALGLPES